MRLPTAINSWNSAYVSRCKVSFGEPHSFHLSRYADQSAFRESVRKRTHSPPHNSCGTAAMRLPTTINSWNSAYVSRMQGFIRGTAFLPLSRYVDQSAFRESVRKRTQSPPRSSCGAAATSLPTAKNLEALIYGRQIRLAGASSWPPALPAHAIRSERRAPPSRWKCRCLTD